jgi:hypothetical protein
VAIGDGRTGRVMPRLRSRRNVRLDLEPKSFGAESGGNCLGHWHGTLDRHSYTAASCVHGTSLQPVRGSPE